MWYLGIFLSAIMRYLHNFFFGIAMVTEADPGFFLGGGAPIRNDVTDQLRADLVNLASNENSDDSDTPELEEQDGVEASRPSDEEGDEENNTMAYSSMFEGPYASHFNTQIANINDELKTIKSLLNFLTIPQTNVDTSESVINKLRQENDSIRRELIAEKERNNGLVEERESLKLVVKLLSKNL